MENKMDNKVLVRLGHGYYRGGVTPLPDVCPTIDAHIDCWHILIGEKMEDIKCRVVGNLKDKRYNEMTSRVYSPSGLAPTKQTCCGRNHETKIVEPLALDEQNGYIRQDGTCGTLTTDGSSPKHNNRVVENYRIRKLTPKECGRLMGVKDDDIDKMSVNQSNSSLYHCFGDALVTTVMGAIFCNMMDTPLSFDEMIKSLYNSPNR